MVVLCKRTKNQTAKFSKFSEWLNDIAFVLVELLAQFRQSSDKKRPTSTDQTKQPDPPYPRLPTKLCCLSFILTQKAQSNVLFAAINTHG